MARTQAGLEIANRRYVVKQTGGLVTRTPIESRRSNPRILRSISGERILAKKEGTMETTRSFQRSRISNPVMLLVLVAMVATFMLGGVGGFVARALIIPGAGPSAIGVPAVQTGPTTTRLFREPATHRAGPQLVS